MKKSRPLSVNILMVLCHGSTHYRFRRLSEELRSIHPDKLKLPMGGKCHYTIAKVFTSSASSNHFDVTVSEKTLKPPKANGTFKSSRDHWHASASGTSVNLLLATSELV